MAHRNKRTLLLYAAFSAFTIAGQALAQQNLSETKTTIHDDDTLQQSAIGATRTVTVSTFLGANGRDRETARICKSRFFR